MEDGNVNTLCVSPNWVNVARENAEYFFFSLRTSKLWSNGFDGLPGPSITAWISVRLDSLTDILIPSSFSCVRSFTSLLTFRMTCGLWFSKFDIWTGKIRRLVVWKQKKMGEGREKHELAIENSKQQKFIRRKSPCGGDIRAFSNRFWHSLNSSWW